METQISMLENKLNALKTLTGYKNKNEYFEHASYNFCMAIQIILILIVMKYLFSNNTVHIYKGCTNHRHCVSNDFIMNAPLWLLIDKYYQ